MAINQPGFLLKVIWLTHFVLSSWALLSGFGGVTIYLYTNVAFFACGLWTIISVESTDAVIMFLATLAVSFFNDILLLCLYEPRFHDVYETNLVTTSARNEYRFALGMCITNLILKPLSTFVLYRIYESRASGSEFSFGIPGLDTSTFVGTPRAGYNDIESSPGHTTISVIPNDPSPYRPNDPSPYRPNDPSLYRPNDPPLYQSPAYQETPPMGPVDTSRS